MEFMIAGRKITVFNHDSIAPCPMVWLNTFEDEGAAVWNACQALHTPDFILATIQIEHWNDDLSPWQAPKLYKQGTDFAGNAAQFRSDLTEIILPEITAYIPVKPQYHAISGYSLAGLFAVWTLFQASPFRRAASASGSFWYPGFLEFAQQHSLSNPPDAVYFSLGDKESCTRHPVMKTVGDRTDELYQHFNSLHIPTIFEHNPGNHFREPAARMAKGIKWMLEQ